MSNKLSPIAIFCFNRPDLLEHSLRSLKACPEFGSSPIFAFSDGPRNSTDVEKVIQVRNILDRDLPKSSTIIKREGNIGLAENIIDGVSRLCMDFGRVIVLEDDLIFHQQFLSFMNQCLNAYEMDENIYQVAGHLIASKMESAHGRAFLLTNTSSWGWGTWARAWKCFDPLAQDWESMSHDRVLRKRFNLSNTYDYYTMLKNQMLFNIDSWAIRWYWSVFKKNGLVVYPPFNLVDNSGMRGDGSHGRGWFRSFGAPTTQNSPKSKVEVPPQLRLNSQLQAEFFSMVWNQNGKYVGQLVDFLKRIYWRIRYNLTQK